jgi:hypothetical protein
VNRYRGIALPVVLIGLGLLALLANVGAITWGQIGRLVDLWPLLLIVIGIELILRRAAGPPVATGVGAAVALVAVVAAVAYVAAGPGFQVGSQTGSASAPLGSAESGRLAVSGGGISITARTADIGSDLYRATFEYPQGEQPTVKNQDGAVTIDFSGNRRHLFGSIGRRTLDISLSTQVAWTLNLSGGGINADANLSSGHLKGLSVSGGGVDLTVRLPAPQGTVPISVSGGGINAELHRPAGVAARVTVSGGGSEIDADGSHRSALAGSSVWSSPDYGGATDRYDISAAGGGCHVSIDTAG